MIKTRFCPSPTGEIHLGNARTALFCDLLARHGKGTLLLRIEDTDQERSKDEHVHQLYQDLRWLGIDWQEGPEAGGNNGPYFQSQRQDIYNNYYHTLTQKGLLYPCFCTNEQLEIQRKIQRSRGIAPKYSGTCRHLTESEIAEKKAAGLKPTYRFRVHDNQSVEFIDLVKGPQKFNTTDIGDFIIQRADGTAPFLYCNAIDDALMGVTHVLRGEDHLTNTPRQLLILEALELPKPAYGHISLIMAIDGSPLSKRHGSRSIKELKREGFFPEAVINYMARLGHYYANTQFLSHDQLAAEFAVEHLGRAAAKFDESQLLYWQKEAVMKATPEALSQWLAPVLNIPNEHQHAFIDAIRGNILFPREAADWADIIYSKYIDYSDENREILKSTEREYFLMAIKFIQNKGLELQNLFEELKLKLGLKGKALFQPLRIALTNKAHGPEMAKIVPLMGIERALTRLERALTR